MAGLSVGQRISSPTTQGRYAQPTSSPYGTSFRGNSSYIASRAGGASIPVQTTFQPVTQASPVAPPQSASEPYMRASTSLSTSRSTSMPTAPMTFSPTQLTKPQRQAVNDPGIFGQQAAGVNNRLAQLLDPSYSEVRSTDRDVNPLFQSIDRNSQQSARLMQAQAAERAAAEGTLESGGFAGMNQQIMEQARQQAGDQQAQLMWDKSRERQAQIQQALQLGAGLLDGQQERNLKRELADLQNEQQWNDTSLKRDLGFGDLNLRSALGFGDLDVRNRGLDIQHELGLGDLDVRRQGLSLQDKLGTRGLDLQERGMNLDNDYRYDRLGFDRSVFESQMNQNIINQLLGF